MSDTERDGMTLAEGRDPWRWERRLRHAGAIFLGAFTSESLGDYCAGPNHVLPTSGTARFSSPLGVTDFQKRSSLIEVSAAGAAALGPIAAELAHGEVKVGTKECRHGAVFKLWICFNASFQLTY